MAHTVIQIWGRLDRMSLVDSLILLAGLEECPVMAVMTRLQALYCKSAASEVLALSRQRWLGIAGRKVCLNCGIRCLSS